MKIRSRLNLQVRRGTGAAGRQVRRSVTHWRHMVATIVMLILALAVVDIIFGVVQAALRAFVKGVLTLPEDLSLHLIRAPAWAGIALCLGLAFLAVVGAWFALRGLSKYERPL